MTKHRNKPRSADKPAEVPVQFSTRRRDILAVAIGLSLIILSIAGLWWLNRDATASVNAPAPVDDPSASPGANSNIQWIMQLDQLPPGKAERVELAYFHRTQRCKSCQEAERLIRKTLDTFFADKISSGLVGLTTIDVQNPQNAAMTRKYGASGSSLFFGIVKNGVEYICPINDVWYVLGNEARFLPLLRDRINAALGEG